MVRRKLLNNSAGFGVLSICIVLGTATLLFFPGSVGSAQRATLSKGSRPRTIPEKQQAYAREILTRTGVCMVFVPAGEYTMGSETGEYDEKPAHKVRLCAFYMDKYEVTQEHFKELMGEGRWFYPGNNNPADAVSWKDAVRYCNRRSLTEGLQPCYDENTLRCDFDVDGYRLPTEAEWEYACRAGSDTRYSFGNDGGKLGDYAWHYDNSEKKTHPVGQKAPNVLGLYDMYGNVKEWCHDFYGEDYYATSPSDDPRGPCSGEYRVARGGCYMDPRDWCTSSYRSAMEPTWVGCRENVLIGIRCVRKPFLSRRTMLEDNPEQAKLRKEVRGRIYFKSDTEKAQGTNQGTRLYVVDADGGNLRTLRDFAPAKVLSYSVTWDGRRIAVSVQTENNGQELWVVRHDGAEAERVFHFPQGTYPKDIFPAWSPDGKWLAFTHGKELSARNMETGETRSLARCKKGAMREVTWSRTWTLLFDRGKSSAPHTLQVDENCNPVGEPRFLGRSLGCRKKISPDGKWILAILTETNLTHSVFVIPAQTKLGGQKAKLRIPIEVGPDGLVEHTRSRDDCCWSPDGRHIVYVHTPQREKLEDLNIKYTGPKVLCVCRARGGPQIWITDASLAPYWPIWGKEPEASAGSERGRNPTWNSVKGGIPP